MLPPVTSCQLPLTTHISFLSPACFGFFVSIVFAPPFYYFLPQLTFVSRSRAVNGNLLHLFFSVSGFVFHTSVSPMTADRLKGAIFMTFKFFNIQASLDSVTVSLFVWLFVLIWQIIRNKNKRTLIVRRAGLSRHPLIAISNLFICTQNLNNHPPIHSVSPWNICRCFHAYICRRNVFANAPDIFLFFWNHCGHFLFFCDAHVILVLCISNFLFCKTLKRWNVFSLSKW